MSEPKVIPLGNRVIIKRDETPGKTPSGLFLPESSIVPSCEGIVKEVGRGVTLVKTGDKVIFSKHAGVDISVDRKLDNGRTERVSYTITVETNIIAIIEEDVKVNDPEVSVAELDSEYKNEAERRLDELG